MLDIPEANVLFLAILLIDVTRMFRLFRVSQQKEIEVETILQSMMKTGIV